MPQTGVRVSGRTLTGATLDGSRVKLAGPGIITFNLKFERTGHYTIAASAPAGWKPEEPDPKNIFAQTAPTDQPVAVGLTPPSATSAGDLTLTISSSDATPAVAVQYVQPITH